MLTAYYFYPNDSTCYKDPQPGGEPEAITHFTNPVKEYHKKDYSPAGWKELLTTLGVLKQ